MPEQTEIVMTTLPPSHPRHFINFDDIQAETLKGILNSAHALKKQKFSPPQLFAGLSLAMIFDKKSTRTRLSFEVAMKQLGGHTIVMTKDEMQLGGAESVEDTAKVLSRFVDGVMIRLSDHALVEELA
jgi:ornithine carbamoyltransferase